MPAALAGAVARLAADPRAARRAGPGRPADGARPQLASAVRRADRPLRGRAGLLRLGGTSGDGGGSMTTFVALGDSITLGIGDPGPAAAGRPPGWPRAARAREAGAAGPSCWPTACRSRAAHRRRQRRLHGRPRARPAAAALQLRPDVASVVIGVNDTLRPNFDPDRIGRPRRTRSARCARPAPRC